jgi:lysophospholipase
MERWPNGQLTVIENAQHEVMMEVPETRTRVLQMIVSHFNAAHQ